MSNYEIEVAPVSADIRIGSVIELEDGNSYEVVGVEEESGYGGGITLYLGGSTKRASQRVCFRQIVVTYGRRMEVNKVRIVGYSRPHIGLKEMKA